MTQANNTIPAPLDALGRPEEQLRGWVRARRDELSAGTIVLIYTGKDTYTECTVLWDIERKHWADPTRPEFMLRRNDTNFQMSSYASDLYVKARPKRVMVKSGTDQPTMLAYVNSQIGDGFRITRMDFELGQMELTHKCGRVLTVQTLTSTRGTIAVWEVFTNQSEGQA